MVVDALRKQMLKNTGGAHGLPEDEDGASFRERRARARERCSDLVGVVREVGRVEPADTVEGECGGALATAVCQGLAEP